MKTLNMRPDEQVIDMRQIKTKYGPFGLKTTEFDAGKYGSRIFITAVTQRGKEFTRSYALNNFNRNLDDAIKLFADDLEEELDKQTQYFAV